MTPSASGRKRPRRIDERAFHAWLHRSLPAGRTGPLPLGDDVAALPVGEGRVILLTTDALSEGTHFRRASDPSEVGAATAAVSLSDIAAKGGTPMALLLDLLVPPGTPEAWCRAVVQGAERTAARFGAHVVGGDTKPAQGRSVVGTMVGIASSSHLPGRDGARIGDRVLVTGSVGRGGVAAVALSRRGLSSRALHRLLEVHPRVAEGRALAPLAHAMTDTSDGIAEAARLIARASNVQILLDDSVLPWEAVLRSEPPARRRRIGFFGGDYELFATLPRSRVARARRALEALGTRLTDVGEVRPGRGAFLHTSPRGAARPLGPPGWDPFRAPSRRGPRR